MTTFDLIVRNGSVVDGTGAPMVRADIGVIDDRVSAIGDLGGERAEVELDATDRIVTPGFVDIHTHLDAQLAWDPIGTSSCWHGVTTVVMGNCGVTFAPCSPDDREYLALMMESVEDIPATSILEGLPWDWVTYGEYLASVDKLAKGVNVGGMVGHCAVRYHVMGDRSLGEEPASADDIAAMCDAVDEAMAGGALGFSTSRTYLHRVPDGRPVPGTYAAPEELLAIGDVLGRHGRGVFEAAARLGEGDDDSLTNTKAEIRWMSELSRRTGRPVTFGLAQSNRRPDLYARVIQLTEEGNLIGGRVRPQTTARGIGIVLGIANNTPYGRCPAWRELRDLPLAARLAAMRQPDRRAALIDEADGSGFDAASVFVLAGPDARYDCTSDDSLAAHAARRGVSPAEAFIDLSLETEGAAAVNFPFLNQSLDAVAAMLGNKTVVMGLADAGAHVGQIMDASQPTFFLTYWVREKGFCSIEEGVRRLTSDTAGLFGVKDRGVLRPGAFADINVIDFDGLRLPTPEYVHDFPGGAGRYIQRSAGFDTTIVNGKVFMQGGEHTGALAGRTVRSTD
jgi:N-acyl-D-aspartate/D-glutamate deacylase